MKYPHTVTNNPYSFFEFQTDEQRLKDILKRKGLKYGAGRWPVLYAKWAQKSSEVKNAGATQVSEVEMHNLLDLCEMNTIIRALESIPADILGLKWDFLSKGTLNRFEETAPNSIARDTQFELLLYADLVGSGVNCELHEPNPDILVKQGERGVNIQCKRIFNYTPNSIARNVHNAAKQLSLDHNENGNPGIIALSTERVFSGGNSLLTSDDEYSAIRYIRNLHDKFNTDNKRYWCSKGVLGTSNIPMVLLYTSTMAKLNKSNLKFAHVTEKDMMGTIPSDQSRKQFRRLHRIINPNNDLEPRDPN